MLEDGIHCYSLPWRNDNVNTLGERRESNPILPELQCSLSSKEKGSSVAAGARVASSRQRYRSLVSASARAIDAPMGLPTAAGSVVAQLATPAEDSLRDEYAYHRDVAARAFHEGVAKFGAGGPQT